MRRSDWSFPASGSFLAVCAALSAAPGCNAIFGITEGQRVENSTTGDGGSAGPGGGEGADGGGAAGGGGAAEPSPACLPAPFVGRAPDDCEDIYLSDRDNCCIAGRSCLGGACEQGRCMPVALDTSAASMGHEAIGVAVEGDGDDDRVFWGSGFGNTIFATDKAPDGETEALTRRSSYVTMLASEGGSLFFTDWSAPDLFRIPLEGNVVVQTVARGVGEARSARPVAGGGWVYWFTGERRPDGDDPWAYDAPRRIWAARADQTDQDASPVLDRDVLVGGLALDETHLYWTEYELGGTQVTVQRMPIGEPSAPERVASAPAADGDSPGDITVADRVYWVFKNDIHVVNKDGSGAGVLTSAGWPSILVADSTFVYWIADGPRALLRVRASGGEPEELTPVTEPRGLAQDCRAVYWTQAGSETSPPAVYKLAK